MRARIRDTELFYDIDGLQLVPDGTRMARRPVLFLLHGGPGGDHVSFKTQIGGLRDVAQLVYIDHRGSGRSLPADPETYTLDNNIDDVEGLREHFGLQRVSILGLSYGGMVAQGYAIRYPERVANLVLSATAPSHRFIDDARRIVEQRGTDEQKRVCQRLWNANFESLEQLHEFYRVMGPLYSLKHDPLKFEENWQRSVRNVEQLNRGFGGFLRTFDFTAELDKIRCPTLVLAGAHDWICPPDHSRLIAENISRAHLKIFAHSSHLIAQDEPDEYLAAVRGFLTYAAV